MFFNQYESFPESKFKDMVDAGSSSFNEIESAGTYTAPPKKSTLGKSSYWK
jgi:phage terminase large subunit-like protein